MFKLPVFWVHPSTHLQSKAKWQCEKVDHTTCGFPHYDVASLSRWVLGCIGYIANLYNPKCIRPQYGLSRFWYSNCYFILMYVFRFFKIKSNIISLHDHTNSLSWAPSTILRWYRLLGVRVNWGGLRSRIWASRWEIFSALPLLKK